MRQFAKDGHPQVYFGPADPVEAARSDIMRAVLDFRGDHGINLVAQYSDRLDEIQALYERAGYDRVQIIQIRDIIDRARAKAIEDQRVLAYLGV